MDTLSFLAAMATALGGCELVKYLINRRSNSRISRAQAELEEFHTLREYNEFLQKQLVDNAALLAEESSHVRSLNQEMFNLNRELHQKRCDVINCKERKP